MMKLTCRDIDSSSTCDFESTGSTATEVASIMMAHAKADHSLGVKGMTDTQIMNMMEAKVHE